MQGFDDTDDQHQRDAHQSQPARENYSPILGTVKQVFLISAFGNAGTHNFPEYITFGKAWAAFGTPKRVR